VDSFCIIRSEEEGTGMHAPRTNDRRRHWRFGGAGALAVVIAGLLFAVPALSSADPTISSDLPPQRNR